MLLIDYISDTLPHVLGESYRRPIIDIFGINRLKQWAEIEMMDLMGQSLDGRLKAAMEKTVDIKIYS